MPEPALTASDSMTGDGRLWSRVQDSLRDRISESAFNMWLRPLRLVEAKQDWLVLGCPNALSKRRVAENFLGALSAAASEVLEHPVEVSLEIDREAGRSVEIQTCRPESGQRAVREVGAADRGVESAEPVEPVDEPGQLPLPRLGGSVIPLNPKFVFSEFITGQGNKMAFAAARALASGTELYTNLMMLTSAPGLGKSHLTQAVGHYILSHRRGTRVCYTTTEDFINEMVQSLKRGQMDKFKDKYRTGCDVLLLECVNFLSGKRKVQAELAYTIDALINAGRVVVFTGHCPPRDIPHLDGEITSRLGGGVVISIDPPDRDTRARILRHKARRMDLKVSGAVVDYLAERLTGDVRQIEACLAGLATRSRFMDRPLDLSLAREVSEEVAGAMGGLDLEAIEAVVCRAFNLTREQLVSRSRQQRIVLPRNLAIHFVRKYTDLSLAAIGEAFERDHATVLHSLRRVEQLIRQDSKVAGKVRYLEGRLKSIGGAGGTGGADDEAGRGM